MRGRAAAAAVCWAIGAAPWTACGSPPAPEPRILYGEQECARCRMIVSEERYAAASVGADGTTRAFDDIGCLVAWVREAPERPGELWVHDAGTGAWLPAAQAVFARGADLITPMGSGWAAFGSPELVGPPVDTIVEGPIGWSELRARAPRPGGR